MAQITLDGIGHAYVPGFAKSDKDYALKPLHHVWEAGKAYALLGPSGCGKTTLLNIISGLVIPSEGRLLFDDTRRDAPAHRAAQHRAGVQFPVLYDTMTVAENLAFPLKNRRMPKLRSRHASPRSPRCWISRRISDAAPAASRPTPSRRSRSDAASCDPTSRPCCSTNP